MRSLSLRCTQNLQEMLPLSCSSNQIAQPSSAGIERTQGYSTTKKSEPQSFGFPPQFPTMGGRFFFYLIDQLSPQRLIPSGVARALSTVTLFWEVGFPPQFLIRLGGFLSTCLSHSPASRIEFWSSQSSKCSRSSQIACILPGFGAVLAFGAIAKKFLFLTLQGVGFPP